MRQQADKEARLAVVEQLLWGAAVAAERSGWAAGVWRAFGELRVQGRAHGMLGCAGASGLRSMQRDAL